MENKLTHKFKAGQFLLLTLILSENQCKKFTKTAKDNRIPGAIILHGKGTVDHHLLNFWGIKSQRKEVVSLVLESSKALEVLDLFTKNLQLDEIGHGIAYLTSLVKGEEFLNKEESPWNHIEGMEESMYKKLTVIVNRGQSEEVMEIARKFGVKGGTIMHGRGTGSEYTATLFGMDIEPEKELVVILMPNDLVEPVVENLYKELQLDLPSNGILFVEPILEVRGLLR